MLPFIFCTTISTYTHIEETRAKEREREASRMDSVRVPDDNPALMAIKRERNREIEF